MLRYLCASFCVRPPLVFCPPPIGWQRRDERLFRYCPPPLPPLRTDVRHGRGGGGGGGGRWREEEGGEGTVRPPSLFSSHDAKRNPSSSAFPLAPPPSAFLNLLWAGLPLFPLRLRRCSSVLPSMTRHFQLLGETSGIEREQSSSGYHHPQF